MPEKRKIDENMAPEKANSQHGRYRKISKAGPPSRAELEERNVRIAEFKRAREQKKKVEPVVQRQSEIIIEQVENSKVEQTEFEEKIESPVPKWCSNDNFWIQNRVFTSHYCSLTGTIIIDKIRPPHIRFFKLSQVQQALARGEHDLAKAMFQVITAPNQLPYNDAVKKSELAKKLKNRFISEESKDSLNDEDVAPEISIPSTPVKHESDLEVDTVLQSEIEEATRRHSIILGIDPNVTPPEFRSVRKATKMIVDDGLLDSVKKRLIFNEGPRTETKCKRQGIDLTNLEDFTGSVVKYALLTPSKRIKEMLQTDVVVSPVRRSARLTENETNLIDSLDDLPANSDIGYLPNRSITASPSKKPTLRK